MTANMTQSVSDQSKLILELSIDAFGLVTRKESELNRKDTLEGTLLLQIYPRIKVARVSVPTELDAYEQSLVESRMANLTYQGIQYKLACEAVYEECDGRLLPISPICRVLP